MRAFCLLLLLIGCPAPDDEPPERTPPGDDGPPDYVSPHPDPVEVLDTYGGPSFSELNETVYADGFVYFCSGVLGMNVYDARDPTDLRFRSRIGFSLGNPSFPRCQHVAPDVEGARAYVSNRANSMQPESWIGVVDLADMNRPEEVGMHVLVESPEAMAVHGSLLLVAAHDAGLLVFERGEGGDLTELGRAPTTNAWGVAVAGTHAYVADGAGGLVTVDISAPDAPRVVATLPLDGAAKDVELTDDGSLAAVAIGTAGVALLSLEDPASPALLEAQNTPGTGTAVAWGAATGEDGVERRALYLADWSDVRVFEVSDGLELVAREPLPLGPSNRRDSRTMGIGAHGDVFFSGNWTELVSYRWVPGRRAPDLEVSRNPVLLPQAAPGERAAASVVLTNSGTETLTVRDVEVDLEGLTVDPLPPTMEPGASTAISLSWVAPAELGVNTVVHLLTDDPDQPELRLRVEANRQGVGVGEAAPDAVFDDIDGETIALSELRGSVVLLAYFATF